VVVPPIIGTRPCERLPREQARAELGLPCEGIAVGVMLGTATNFDTASIRRAILDHLWTRPDVHVVEIGPEGNRPRDDGLGLRRVMLYPAARHSAAFDFMVTAAGYNSFHETMLHGVPTVFVPNEAPEMDLQILRARHARSMGYGELLRASDAISVCSVIERMLDPETRDAMRERLGRLSAGDGAAEAAALLVQLGRMLRLRQPL
jgi:UDP:flavonoid glycosyltransferase YjiC (YdhE family)